MSSVARFRGAVGLCGFMATFVCLGTPGGRADVKEDEVDLTLSEGDKGFTNSIGMTMKRIPKGKFMMGSADDDKDANAEEKPRHEVEITKDFYLGMTEVTQGQWKKVMGKDNNPSFFSKGGEGKASVKKFSEKELDQFPVDMISRMAAQDFLKKLSARQGEKGRSRGYRLPSEAEWEYACRAGAANKKYHFGDTLSDKQANFADSKLNRTCKVGSYPANKFGLYDMHGNVWEHCADTFHHKAYANSLKRDPLCLEAGPFRLSRGGSWYSAATDCRSARRGWDQPTYRSSDSGFRVALDAAR